MSDFSTQLTNGLMEATRLSVCVDDVGLFYDLEADCSHVFLWRKATLILMHEFGSGK